MVTFPAGETFNKNECFSVRITDDFSLEKNNESFTLHITDVEERVLKSGIVYTFVWIEDDDCKNSCLSV